MFGKREKRNRKLKESNEKTEVQEEQVNDTTLELNYLSSVDTIRDPLAIIRLTTTINPSTTDSVK